MNECTVFIVLYMGPIQRIVLHALGLRSRNEDLSAARRSDAADPLGRVHRHRVVVASRVVVHERVAVGRVEVVARFVEKPYS